MKNHGQQRVHQRGATGIASSWWLRLGAAVAGGAVALAGASCKVTSDYRRPTLDVGGTYRSKDPTTTQAAKNRLGRNWWELFGDPQLTALEEAAAKYNPDLQAAMMRVVEAREASKAVKSQFYPVITADPSLSRSSTGSNRGVTGIGGGGGVAGVGSTGGAGRTTTNYSIPFDLSYEVDLWGRVRRSVEQSNAQAEATADAYFVLLQTLQADLAEDYFNMRSLDTQDRIFETNVGLYRKQLHLTELQKKAGLLGPTDVLQIQTLLDSTLAQQIDVRRQREDLEHAIAILTGRPPVELSLAVNPLTAVAPPLIPAGLPSDLLLRRPDVAEAEQNLKAASANIGVQAAAFYPKLTLAASAGLENIDIGSLFSPASRFSSVGPSLSIPIFEGGRLTAQLRQAKAQYDEVYAAYRSSVLSALRDVEDALNDLHYFEREVVAQQRAVNSARETVRLLDIQANPAVGIISELQLIDADRTLLTNELSANQVLTQRQISTVLLIKAVGGGWSPPANATQPGLHLTTLPGHSPTARFDADVPAVKVFPPQTMPTTFPAAGPVTLPATTP